MTEKSRVARSMLFDSPCILMLEVLLKNVSIPSSLELEETVAETKIIIAFRTLNNDWTTVTRTCHEKEAVYEGRSLIFSTSESNLEQQNLDDSSDIDVQFYVLKRTCKYFEEDRKDQTIGFTVARATDLFEGISRDLQERKKLVGHSSKGGSISRCKKGIYPLLKESLEATDATIEAYIRASYLGNHVLTEISFNGSRSISKETRARSARNENIAYLLREEIVGEGTETIGSDVIALAYPPKRETGEMSRESKAIAKAPSASTDPRKGNERDDVEDSDENRKTKEKDNLNKQKNGTSAQEYARKAKLSDLKRTMLASIRKQKQSGKGRATNGSTETSKHKYHSAVTCERPSQRPLIYTSFCTWKYFVCNYYLLSPCCDKGGGG